MRPQQSAPPQARPPQAAAREPMDPFHVSLAAAPGAAAAARMALAAWLADPASALMLADAQLVVSELVANSVRHADAPVDAIVSVSARVHDDVLRLEVGDSGSSGSVAQRAPDLRHGGGFGLNVVDVLSRRWGVDRDAGTRVWAELAFPPAG